MGSIDNLSFMISQMNSQVGNIEQNKGKILAAIEEAEATGADILIFPELALTGYPPLDLVYYSSFRETIHDALETIKQNVQTVSVILGTVLWDEDGNIRNGLVVIENQEIKHEVYKTLLPNYDVFNESRYFKPGKPQVVTIKGTTFGLQICEDAWDHLWMHDISVSSMQKSMGAECIINISASPFSTNKAKERLELVKHHVEKIKIPFFYINMVGGQDEIVFDGRSFAINSEGNLSFSLPAFAESLYFVRGSIFNSEFPEDEYFLSDVREWYEGIRLNLGDYLHKSGLNNKLLIALSGGIDSAVTLVLAAHTVGSENVTAVFMPTKYSSNQSLEDSKTLCKNLKVQLIEFPIEHIRETFQTQLFNLNEIDKTWGIAEENIQARIRSNIIMYLSNKLNSLVISTGNKSEIATGYCTLYGDTAGGKNLLGDLYKTQVYRLAEFINTEKEIIPTSIIKRPPTAELKEDQLDQDTLPPYEQLDQILYYLIESSMGTEEIVAKGFDKETVAKVARMLMLSEYKRAQMVQTVKLSPRNFGMSWKFPIAKKFVP